MIEYLTTKFGNKAQNQTVTTMKGIKEFYSYGTLIAKYNEGTQKLVLDDKWDYSKTTLFYFKQFINNHTKYNYESKSQFIKLISNNKNITIEQKQEEK